MNFAGILVTVIYIVAIVVMRYESLLHLETMPLNEFGDFFAGVFGPLMLFWLILGYVQQQKELQQNTSALQLQAKELRRSVEQHKELVKATKGQLQMDLKFLEIEKTRVYRESHPRFSIVHSGRRRNSGGKGVYEIGIRNSGRSAFEVTFSTEPVLTLKTPSFVDHIGEGKAGTLKWDADANGSVPKELKLIVRCRDEEARWHTMTFQFILVDNGKDKLISVGEVGS